MNKGNPQNDFGFYGKDVKLGDVQVVGKEWSFRKDNMCIVFDDDGKLYYGLKGTSMEEMIECDYGISDGGKILTFKPAKASKEAVAKRLLGSKNLLWKLMAGSDADEKWEMTIRIGLMLEDYSIGRFTRNGPELIRKDRFSIAFLTEYPSDSSNLNSGSLEIGTEIYRTEEAA